MLYDHHVESHRELTTAWESHTIFGKVVSVKPISESLQFLVKDLNSDTR